MTCPNCTRYDKYLDMDEKDTYFVCINCGFEVEKTTEEILYGDAHVETKKEETTKAS